MVEAASPVDCDVTFVTAQACSSLLDEHEDQVSVARAFDVPIEPPAEIEQNSKRPSNTGQSSPTLSVEG